MYPTEWVCSDPFFFPCLLSVVLGDDKGMDRRTTSTGS